jgi:serine protease AprX
VHEYVGENSYLCGAPEGALARVRQLEYIIYADIYQQFFKVQPSLKLSAPTRGLSTSNTHTVDVIFHENVDPRSKAIQDAIAKNARVDGIQMEMGRHKVRLTMQDQYLADVAKIDEVKVIQQVHPVMAY